MAGYTLYITLRQPYIFVLTVTNIVGQKEISCSDNIVFMSPCYRPDIKAHSSNIYSNHLL